MLAARSRRSQTPLLVMPSDPPHFWIREIQEGDLLKLACLEGVLALRATSTGPVNMVIEEFQPGRLVPDRPIGPGWHGYLLNADLGGVGIGPAIVSGANLMVYLLAPQQRIDDDACFLLHGVAGLTQNGVPIFGPIEHIIISLPTEYDCPGAH